MRHDNGDPALVRWTAPNGEVITGASTQEIVDKIWMSHTPEQIAQLKRDVEARSRQEAKALRRF